MEYDDNIKKKLNCIIVLNQCKIKVIILTSEKGINKSLLKTTNFEKKSKKIK